MVLCCAEGCGFDPLRVKLKTLKLVFAASSLSTQHLGVRAKTGRTRVRIICLGKVACLPVDCRFRGVAREKSGSNCRSSTKQDLFIIIHKYAFVLNMHGIFAVGR